MVEARANYQRRSWSLGGKDVKQSVFCRRKTDRAIVKWPEILWWMFYCRFCCFDGMDTSSIRLDPKKEAPFVRKSLEHDYPQGFTRNKLSGPTLYRALSTSKAFQWGSQFQKEIVSKRVKLFHRFKNRSGRSFR
jgi:hypothetical protein